jgi:hypothetical protein
MSFLMKTSETKKFVNPIPHCLGILKAFFVKMKISPGWLKQNIFKQSKIPRKNLNKKFSPAPLFLPLVCFISPASAFRASTLVWYRWPRTILVVPS